MRHAPAYPKLVVPLLLRTTNDNSGGSSEWGGRMGLCAKLVITAITGAAATLNVTIEHADTLGGSYTVADTFPAQTGTTTGVTRSMIAPLKPFVRVAWTMTGTTPNITFSVSFARTEPLMLVG